MKKILTVLFGLLFLQNAYCDLLKGTGLESEVRDYLNYKIDESAIRALCERLLTLASKRNVTIAIEDKNGDFLYPKLSSCREESVDNVGIILLGTAMQLKQTLSKNEQNEIVAVLQSDKSDKIAYCKRLASVGKKYNITEDDVSSCDKFKGQYLDAMISLLESKLRNATAKDVLPANEKERIHNMLHSSCVQMMMEKAVRKDLAYEQRNIKQFGNFPLKNITIKCSQTDDRCVVNWHGVSNSTQKDESFVFCYKVSGISESDCVNNPDGSTAYQGKGPYANLEYKSRSYGISNFTLNDFDYSCKMIKTYSSDMTSKETNIGMETPKANFEYADALRNRSSLDNIQLYKTTEMAYNDISDNQNDEPDKDSSVYFPMEVKPYDSIEEPPMILLDNGMSVKYNPKYGYNQDAYKREIQKENEEYAEKLGDKNNWVIMDAQEPIKPLATDSTYAQSQENTMTLTAGDRSAYTHYDPEAASKQNKADMERQKANEEYAEQMRNKDNWSVIEAQESTENQNSQNDNFESFRQRSNAKFEEFRRKSKF